MADPEQMLLSALSSCHMLWFLDLARQARFVVESYEDEAVAEMGRVGPGKVAITKITLHPRIAFAGAAPDAADAVAPSSAAAPATSAAPATMAPYR